MKIAFAGDFTPNSKKFLKSAARARGHEIVETGADIVLFSNNTLAAPTTEGISEAARLGKQAGCVVVLETRTISASYIRKALKADAVDISALPLTERQAAALIRTLE